MWSVWFIFCDCGFILSALWRIRLRGLCKFPDGRDWLWGNLGLVLMWWWGGGAMLRKSLIQFLVDGWGYVASLLFGLRPNYSRGNGRNGNLLQKDLCQHCCIQCPWPHGSPLSTHASTGDSWTLTSKSGSVSCGVTAPFSWVLVHTRFCLYPPRVCFPRVLGDALYGSYVSLVNFKVLQRKGMEFYVNKEILSWAVSAGIP